MASDECVDRLTGWMHRLAPVCAACLAIASFPAASAAPSPEFNTRFVAIAFHDVTDPGEPPDLDSVSTARLVQFFDWLKHDGWTPVSPAEIEAANKGLRPLPPKAILLAFDDGYASVYTRVYPLLLAYRYPAVVALVGEWMDTPAGKTVDYGGRSMPREHFVTWHQVRRMQASGLVEIASHSYALHQTVPISSHGTSAPSARSWIFDRTAGAAETDEAHRQRIAADLARSRDAIARETGREPRVLVWPFGRYSGLALAEAEAAGFAQMLTLEPEAADARALLEIPRYYPTRDPLLGEIVENLRFAAHRTSIRAACVDLSAVAAAPGAMQQEALLGRLIEDLRTLGANVAILDLASLARDVRSNGRLREGEADLLSFTARQLGNRAGVDVYVHLPPGTPDDDRSVALAQNVARAAPITGLALDEDPRAPRIIEAARAIDPQLRLVLIAGREGVTPAGDAHLVLWPPATDSAQAGAQAGRLAATGWFAAPRRGHVLLATPRAMPAEQVRAIRAMQRQGATALALCPWDPAASPTLAPAFSAATFPRGP